MKDLGLVYVAAEGVAHSGVPQGAQGGVEEEGVVVKGQEFIEFRQLQNVNTPTDGKKKKNLVNKKIMKLLRKAC